MLHTRRRPRWGVRFSRQELALIAVTAVWGATFLVVHLAMQHGGPLLFVGLRFLAAGAISTVIFRHTLTGLTRRELGAGAAIGVTIFLGYALQTVGLQTIPSSTSAFLTALYVPLVPLLQWAVFRRAPKPAAWAGVALASTGLLLLADPGSAGLTLSTVSESDLMTLAEAAAYLRTPVATLRYWRHLGSGPAGFRLGRRVMYRREDVDRWIGECQQAQAH